MDATRESEPIPMKNRTTVERKSERELVVTRTFNVPARLVFEAWTKPALLKRWWAPKLTGVTLLSLTAPRARLDDAPEVRRHGDALPAQRGMIRTPPRALPQTAGRGAPGFPVGPPVDRAGAGSTEARMRDGKKRGRGGGI